MRQPSRKLVCALMLSTIVLVGCKGPAKKPAAAPEKKAVTKTEVAPGEYDRRMIKAIQTRWYELLDAQRYGGGVKGKMTVEFRLHADGNVSDVAVVESNIDPKLAELCQKAVKDVAPFGAWPEEMRKQVGKDERVVRFNFSF